MAQKDILFGIAIFSGLTTSIVAALYMSFSGNPDRERRMAALEMDRRINEIGIRDFEPKFVSVKRKAANGAVTSVVIMKPSIEAVSSLRKDGKKIGLISCTYHGQEQRLTLGDVSAQALGEFSAAEYAQIERVVTNDMDVLRTQCARQRVASIQMIEAAGVEGTNNITLGFDGTLTIRRVD